MSIGSRQGPRPWHGCLDEVRITQQALAPDQFLQTREPLPAARGPVPERFDMPFVATHREDAAQWQQQARAKLFELVDGSNPGRSTDELPFQLGEPVDKGAYRLYPASFQGNDRQERVRCLFAVPVGEGRSRRCWPSTATAVRAM